MSADAEFTALDLNLDGDEAGDDLTALDEASSALGFDVGGESLDAGAGASPEDELDFGLELGEGVAPFAGARGIQAAQVVAELSREVEAERHLAGGKRPGEAHLEGLALGGRARVDAQIEAPEIVIAGEFDGEATASGRIELLETARVRATLDARKLVLAEGSFFEGRCRTHPDAEPGPGA